MLQLDSVYPLGKLPERSDVKMKEQHLKKGFDNMKQLN